ncbi:uncharacterized protein [Malus domestica]|uniref:uncharacterized protein n=1 Tax=Malus domestica TaxID=3750 RepID=UPI000498AF7A
MGGQDVKVWSDRWLPSIPSGHPKPMGQQSVSPNLRDESLEHLFLLCTWVHPIWFGGALPYKVDGKAISSWGGWCNDVFSPTFGSASSKNWVQSYIAFTCWFIWKARCDFVFNKVPLNPVSVLLKISAALSSFLKANSSVEPCGVTSFASAPGVASWCALSDPCFKINVDDSWSMVTQQGFVRVLVRVAEGRFVAAARYPICAPSAITAEALALFHGCRLGLKLGFQEVIFKADLSEVISCLSSSVVDNWEASPTLGMIRLLGSSFQSCRWSWVPRLANEATHILALHNSSEMNDYV